MDYYQTKLFVYGVISAVIAICGVMTVDSVLKSYLTIRKRLMLYAGLALELCGYSPFGVRLHKYREWHVIKNAADYHNVSMYHAAKRAAAQAEAEKKNVKDADRSTGVAPVSPSSDKCPGS